MIRIPLDITHLAILQRHIDAATAGAHVTGRALDFGFGHKTSGKQSGAPEYTKHRQIDICQYIDIVDGSISTVDNRRQRGRTRSHGAAFIQAGTV